MMMAIGTCFYLCPSCEDLKLFYHHLSCIMCLSMESILGMDSHIVRLYFLTLYETL